MNKRNPFLNIEHFATLILLTFLFGGCAKLGPATLQWERNNYNISIQRTNDEQLLLNLVRLKYRDTPFFMEVSSVASQFSLKSNASASATLEKTKNAIFGLGAGITLEERPTVTYAPLQGEKFIQRVLSPIPLDTIALLYHSGWSVERVIRLCFQRMNNLKNAPSASGPTPALAPDYEGFLQASKVLRALQIKDALELAYDPRGGQPALILQISKEAIDWPETRELSGYLGVAPGTTRYILAPTLDPNVPNQIKIEPRSLLGIMFYLSQAVEAPSEDQKQGLVTVTRLPSGEPFDWKRVTGDLFRVRSQSTNPGAPSVSIFYRGNWFYIEDTDLTSKSTFSLLAQIFSLQAGKIKSTAPLLTLPIGQ